MSQTPAIEDKSVACRCPCRNADYNQLTPIDWIVLDFTDGVSNFESLQSRLPIRRDDLCASFVHLYELGLLTWGNSSGSSTLSAPNHTHIGQPLKPSMMSDETCANYLPARLFSEFRAFIPQQVDLNLEIDEEIQIFAEFIFSRLSSLSHYDLLGLTEGQCDRAAVKQAYLLRTKQFHPDRYFRKNIGSFGPQIATIFKAVTAAFTTLQRSV